MYFPRFPVFAAVALTTFASLQPGCVADATLAPTTDAGDDGQATDAETGDSAVEAAPSDAGNEAAAPACDLTKAFGAPTVVPTLNTLSDDDSDARLSGDGRTVYFASSRAGGPSTGGVQNIYSASRITVNDPFGAISPLEGVNYVGAGTGQAGPTVTSDGNFIFFSRKSMVATSAHIYVGTRASTISPFSNIATVTALDGPANRYDPYVRPDGKVLYFMTDAQIWRATLGPSGAFEMPAAVSEFMSDDANPVVTADDLTMFFSAVRTGGPGGTDIWVATRASTAVSFSNMALVPQLSSLGNEFPTWISPDGCTIYLATDRNDVAVDAASPKLHIWQASRPN